MPAIIFHPVKISFDFSLFLPTVYSHASALWCISLYGCLFSQRNSGKVEYVNHFGVFVTSFSYHSVLKNEPCSFPTAALRQNQVILYACQTPARFHLFEACSSSESPSLHCNPAELSCVAVDYQGLKSCHSVSYDGMVLDCNL